MGFIRIMSNSCGNIDSWVTLMNSLRINPKAVCRTLLQRLDVYKPLSSTDEARLIDAIESTGINPDRVLASLSRNTLKEVLKNI